MNRPARDDSAWERLRQACFAAIGEQDEEVAMLFCAWVHVSLKDGKFLSCTFDGQHSYYQSYLGLSPAEELGLKIVRRLRRAWIREYPNGYLLRRVDSAAQAPVQEPPDVQIRLYGCVLNPIPAPPEFLHPSVDLLRDRVNEFASAWAVSSERRRWDRGLQLRMETRSA